MAEKQKAKAPKKPKAYKPGKYCLKCGTGYRLAQHKDRLTCGKCGYMEKRETLDKTAEKKS